MSATVETLEAMERPPVSMGSRLEGELLEVSMGPQHPSTHGVLRVVLKLDGETVIDLDCDIGYLHRGMEKIAEAGGMCSLEIVEINTALDVNNKTAELGVELLLSALGKTIL